MTSTILGGAFCDIIKGKLQPDYRWVSREEFHRLKDTDPIVKIVWSFGNNGRDYLYGKDREKLKKAMHYAVVFGDYSMSDALGINLHSLDQYDSLEERYRAYKQLYALAFSKEDKTPPYITISRMFSEVAISPKCKSSQRDSCAAHSKKKDSSRLRPIERTWQTWNALLGLSKWGGKLGCLDLVSTQLDYQEVEILPHSTVYCDIPYKNTDGYGKSKYGGFDYDRFYAWVDSREYPVFISEYQMPSEFTPIACKVRIGTMCQNNNHEVREEKIFVQKRFAEQYRTNLFL